MPWKALTLGVMLPYASQPGLDIGAEYTVFAPNDRVELVLKPHLAGYVRPGNHVSGMIGTDFGVTVHHRVPVSHTFSVGLDYLVQSQLTSTSVDLGSGERSGTRELRHFALPTGSYTFTHMPAERVGWYLDTSLGHTLSVSEIDKTYISIGAGVRFALGAR